MVLLIRPGWVSSSLWPPPMPTWVALVRWDRPHLLGHISKAPATCNTDPNCGSKFELSLLKKNL